MSYAKFSNQDRVEGSIDLMGGNDDSTSGDKERMLSKDATTKRKFPVLIVSIAISVLVIVFGVSIFLTHLNSSDQTSFQIYVFGGLNENFTQHSFASHFNSSSGEWREIHGVPTEATLQGLCGAVADDKIYLFGGSNSLTGYVSNKTIVYDSSANNFTFLQPMPEPRESCAAAVLNDYIYVAGGWNGTRPASLQYKGSSSVIRYNLQTGQWSNVSSMNTLRRRFELAELKGRLYAIGGNETIEAYDPTTDRWSFVTNMPTHLTRYIPGVAVHEGKIYVLELSNDGEEELFEEYSPETNQWKSLNMPDSYELETLLSVNGTLWAFGGHDSKTGKAVFTYDPSAEKWTRQQDMNAAHWLHAAFVTNH